MKFQELKIFENEKLNILCDRLSQIVREITGEELMLCGSVAKKLHGTLPEDYEPKDVDFVVEREAFNKLYRAFPMEIEGVVAFEFQPIKILLWTPSLGACVEIWLLREFEQKLKYQSKIPYII